MTVGGFMVRCQVLVHCPRQRLGFLLAGPLLSVKPEWLRMTLGRPEFPPLE